MLIKVTGLENGPVSQRGASSMKLVFVDEQNKPDSVLLWKNEARSLNVGDWADFQWEMKGKYKNCVSLTKTQAPGGYTAPPALAQNAPYKADPFMKPKHPDEQRAIARSVALAQAVALCAPQKKTDVAAVVGVADEFLGWLMGEAMDFVPEEIPPIPEK